MLCCVRRPCHSRYWNIAPISPALSTQASLRRSVTHAGAQWKGGLSPARPTVWTPCTPYAFFRLPEEISGPSPPRKRSVTDCWDWLQIIRCPYYCLQLLKFWAIKTLLTQRFSKRPSFPETKLLQTKPLGIQKKRMQQNRKLALPNTY